MECGQVGINFNNDFAGRLMIIFRCHLFYIILEFLKQVLMHLVLMMICLTFTFNGYQVEYRHNRDVTPFS